MWNVPLRGPLALPSSSTESAVGTSSPVNALINAGGAYSMLSPPRPE
jgi:hypothetical protein